MKISIKYRFTDKVLFEGEFETTRHVVEAAVKARANLAGANLAGAYLDGANLAGANLAGANLDGAYLDGANLAGANLARAYLDGANLAGANLDGANLAGANLARAYLDGEKLVITPLQILGLRWFVLITPEYMAVGCQRHKHEEWAGFKRTDIAPMADKAWDWWKIHKPILLASCELHRKESETQKAEEAA